jgi:truncated hemoglobin YjbI
MRDIKTADSDLTRNSSMRESLYDRLGGRDCLERVHRRLYERLFPDPAFSLFFASVTRQHQEDQQTDFMAWKLGGPSRYSGRLPEAAHEHLYITEALYDLRHKILSETLDECGVPPDLRDEWLIVDMSFKSMIVKQSIDDCRKRYNSDTILSSPGW